MAAGHARAEEVSERNPFNGDSPGFYGADAVRLDARRPQRLS